MQIKKQQCGVRFAHKRQYSFESLWKIEAIIRREENDYWEAAKARRRKNSKRLSFIIARNYNERPSLRRTLFVSLPFGSFPRPRAPQPARSHPLSRCSFCVCRSRRAAAEADANERSGGGGEERKMCARAICTPHFERWRSRSLTNTFLQGMSLKHIITNNIKLKC